MIYQPGSPSIMVYTTWLVLATAAVLNGDSRCCSWTRIREQQIVRELLAGPDVEFPTPARRPLFSALNCDHFINTFHLQLPDWKDALKLAMETA